MDHENIYERQHSCKWYFDEALDAYDELIITEKTREEGGCRLLNDIGACVKSKNVYKTFSNPLKSEDGNQEHDPLDQSYFPLFLFAKAPTPAEKAEDPNELFERKKFEICKTLNAIDSIVDRLCKNNVDNASVDSEGHVVGKETVLKWLYAGLGSEASNKQSIDRAREFIRQACLFWNDQCQGKVPVSDIEKKCGTQIKEEDETRLVANAKAAITKTITDAHEVYQKLNGFRKYSIRASLAKPEMKNAESLNKVQALADALLKALLACCVSYMRIDKLQLPRGVFANARMLFTNVSDSNFASANFDNANLENGSAKNCDFSMAFLRNVYGRSCDFTGSVFSYADLTNVNFDNANLSKTKIDSVQFGKKNSAELNDILTDIENTANNHSYSDKENFGDNIRGTKNKLPSSSGKKIADPKADAIVMAVKSNEGCFSSFHFADSLDRLAEAAGEQGFKPQAFVDQLLQRGQNISADEKVYDEIRGYIRKLNQWLSDDEYGNERRAELPDVVCLKGATVDDALFPDADLSLVDLSASSFQNTILDGLSLAFAKAGKANFRNAHMYGSFAYETDFSDSTFADALAGSSRFVACTGSSANLEGAAFQNSYFVGEKFKNYVRDLLKDIQPYPDRPDFVLPEPKEDTASSSSDKDTWAGASFKHANGTKSLFACVDLSRAVFEDSLFRSAIFFDCNASSTMWKHADLTFAVLCGVVYNKGSMKNISLQETLIYDCDFTCVNILGSKLLSSRIVQANFYDVNMQNCNLSHSYLSHCVFRDTLLGGTIFSNSLFENCIFKNIDFDGIIGLSRAQFVDCQFIDCRYNGAAIFNKSVKEGKRTIEIGGLSLVSEGQDGIFSKFSTKRKE